MQIKWTEYPDDRARRENRDGIEVWGQVWADAPKAGDKWCIPLNEAKPRAVLVHTRGAAKGLTPKYSIREENA